MVLLRHKPWRRSILSATFALFFFLFFPTALWSVEGVGRNLRGQQRQEERRWEREQVALSRGGGGGELQQQQVHEMRRMALGPGSSPPTCRSMCGRCLPCRPVRVVIQPGRTSPLEYYPEAWRCKCRNKIFMP